MFCALDSLAGAILATPENVAAVQGVGPRKMTHRFGGFIVMPHCAVAIKDVGRRQRPRVEKEIQVGRDLTPPM